MARAQILWKSLGAEENVEKETREKVVMWVLELS